MMNRVPPEIFLRIVQSIKEISSSRLATYACVSRAWQAAIEQETFRDLALTSHEFAEFHEMFSDQRISRRRCLRWVRIQFVFPSEQLHICCEAGRSIDERTITEPFSNSISMLFAILSDLAIRANSPPPLNIRFVTVKREEEREFDYECSGSHTQNDQILAQVQRSFYEVDCDKELPTLYDIRHIEMAQYDELKYLRRNWTSTLLPRLPLLEYLDVEVHDQLEWGRRIRSAQRAELANGISHVPLLHLKNLRLTVDHPRLFNEDITPPIIMRDFPQLDPYNTMIAHLSELPALTSVHLSGPLVISPNFFSDAKSFPSLVYFHLDFAAETADGRWFFSRDEEAFHSFFGDEGESSDDDDSDIDSSQSDPLAPLCNDDDDGPVSVRHDIKRWRTFPATETMEPLLLGAAHAAYRMLNLKRFVLRLRETTSDADHIREQMDYPFLKRIFEVCLLRPGVLRSDYYPDIPTDKEQYIEKSRVWWRVSSTWRPDDDLKKAWKVAAGSNAKMGLLKQENFQEDTAFASYKETYIGEIEIL